MVRARDCCAVHRCAVRENAARRDLARPRHTRAWARHTRPGSTSVPELAAPLPHCDWIAVEMSMSRVAQPVGRQTRPLWAMQASVRYMRASESGHAIAEHNVAGCYHHGVGVAKDLSTSFHVLYEKRARSTASCA